MSRCREDKRLLDAMAGGDVQASGGLYDAYSAQVHHLLLARGLDEATAEDVTQEAFLSLLGRGLAGGRIDNVRNYLFTVARNLATHQHPRDEAAFPEEGEGRESTPAGDLAGDVAVSQVLRQLPPEQAEVMVLKVWHEMTFPEIAAALGISPNTAASRYRYACTKLRELWGDQHE